MNCDRARPLIPLYMDGELSAVQADDLRPHLLECPACRAVVQAEKALKAWFVPRAPVPVPEGFAARVARRALAGDRGEPVLSGDPQVAGGVLHEFVLQALAVAALLLIALSISIRRLEMPADGEIQALQGHDVQSTLQALDELNQREAEAREADREAAADQGAGQQGKLLEGGKRQESED